jgi:FhuF 2Fe-2S C-terminal domain
VSVLHSSVSNRESTAANPDRPHPLTESVAAVDRAVGLLSFRVADVPSVPDVPDAVDNSGLPQIPDARGTGWTECEEALSDPAFFAQWRAKVARWLTEQHALPDEAAVPEKTTGGYVLQWYLIVPAYLGALLFHSARRVPELAANRLRFRLDSATLREVALRPGRFWCLPGDPDAGHPDAVAVLDMVALARVLHDQVIAHASRFLTVYGPQVRFGRRTKWATVTDVLDSGLLLAGRASGSPQAGAADAALVLGSGDKPLTSASTICEVTDDRGRTHWTRRRGSCCFLYALPGVERPCASCPRVSAADRARIFGTLDQA